RPIAESIYRAKLQGVIADRRAPVNGTLCGNWLAELVGYNNSWSVSDLRISILEEAKPIAEPSVFVIGDRTTVASGHVLQRHGECGNFSADRGVLCSKAEERRLTR